MTSTTLARPLALAWGAVALAAAALLPVAAALVASLPACPLRSATGWPCPACGSGRALAALGSGDLYAALAANPLAVAAAAGFGALGVVAALAELAGRPLREPRELAAWARFAIPLALLADWLYLAGAGR